MLLNRRTLSEKYSEMLKMIRCERIENNPDGRDRWTTHANSSPLSARTVKVHVTGDKASTPAPLTLLIFHRSDKDPRQWGCVTIAWHVIGDPARVLKE
jgi:hypothetical protein